MYRRGSRGGRRRGMKAVIQSYKKVINHAPASTAAGVNRDMILVTGVDSVAAGQTSVTDSSVPTGAIVKFIDIKLVVGNSTLANVFCHVAIMYTLTGQGVVSPLTVGGSALRNQVLHQDMFAVQQSQNTNKLYRFKIPKQFQRVREGRVWRIIVNADLLTSSAVQAIYKFYR